MGVYISHDTFWGSYSDLARFRRAILNLTGGSFLSRFYFKYSHKGINKFLSFDDCEDEISPEDCLLIADDLEQLLPKIRKDRDQNLLFLTEKFIQGCRDAANENECLEIS